MYFFLVISIIDGNKISYLDYAVYGFHAQFYVHNG